VAFGSYQLLDGKFHTGGDFPKYMVASTTVQATDSIFGISAIGYLHAHHMRESLVALGVLVFAFRSFLYAVRRNEMIENEAYYRKGWRFTRLKV
jgi:hypothetical protein